MNQEHDQGKKRHICFAFLPLADHRSSQFKGKWLTVLRHNIESTSCFRSAGKQSFWKLFQQDHTKIQYFPVQELSQTLSTVATSNLVCVEHKKIQSH